MRTLYSYESVKLTLYYSSEKSRSKF